MSFENKIKSEFEKNPSGVEHLDISLLKYLWAASPLSFSGKDNYYDFFKKISLFNSFSDNEIRILTKYLHRREFASKEVIFKQGDTGYGFYFIHKGSVDIYSSINSESENDFGAHIIELNELQFFGEMGLLENFNRRSATAIAGQNTVLLGLFKPDLEDLVLNQPVIGAKFLREISMILANRLNYLTKEVVDLKKKLQSKDEK